VPPKLIDLMSELYSGTESAVRCGGTIHDLFPVVTGIRYGCVLAPTLFSTCLAWLLGRMSERSSCGASFGNVKVSDLDFADDAVIFAESLDILLGALEVLNEELEPLRLRVSWVKTKIQPFNDILDAAILSVPVCGEDVEVTERFNYLGSDILSPLTVRQRSIDVWVGPGESWFHWIMGCGSIGTFAEGQKSESSGAWCFQSCSADVRLGL